MSDMERWMPYYRRRSGPENVGFFFENMQSMFNQIMGVRQAMENTKFRQDSLALDKIRTENTERHQEFLRTIESGRAGREAERHNFDLQLEKDLSPHRKKSMKWQAEGYKLSVQGQTLSNELTQIEIDMKKAGKGNVIVDETLKAFSDMDTALTRELEALGILDEKYGNSVLKHEKTLQQYGVKDPVFVTVDDGRGGLTQQLDVNKLIGSDLPGGGAGHSRKNEGLNKLGEEYVNLGVIGAKYDLYGYMRKLVVDDMRSNKGAYQWGKPGNELADNERMIELLAADAKRNDKLAGKDITAFNKERPSKMLTAEDIGFYLGGAIVGMAEGQHHVQQSSTKSMNIYNSIRAVNQYKSELNVKLRKELGPDPAEWDQKKAQSIYTDLINEVITRKDVPDFIKRHFVGVAGEIEVEIDDKTGAVVGDSAATLESGGPLKVMLEPSAQDLFNMSVSQPTYSKQRSTLFEEGWQQKLIDDRQGRTGQYQIAPADTTMPETVQELLKLLSGHDSVVPKIPK